MPHASNQRQTSASSGHDWALVLAAGEGSRLQSLTMTADGVAVPKQFCSIGADTTLLEDALRRAASVAPCQRTCIVLAEQHRRWWQALPLGIPDRNLVVQPRNRGTANGILLPLLRIAERDPRAAVLVLPSDHYVRNEDVLAESLRRALRTVEQQPGRLLLLGITPEEADPELGYIVAAGESAADIRPVSEFVEKPSIAIARSLVARGGVWNSFIFAADCQTLLRAFEARCPEVVREMRAIGRAGDDDARAAALAELYEQLPVLDFSRDILQPSPHLLRVLSVPACGWNDLGTPRRVGETVRRFHAAPLVAKRMSAGSSAFLDLAVRHLQAQEGWRSTAQGAG